MSDDRIPNLNLEDIPDPSALVRSMRAFANARVAWLHLARHLLSPPESEGWALAAPELLAIADLTDREVCYHFRELKNLSDEASPQRFYSAVCVRLRVACHQATYLGWVQTEIDPHHGQTVVAFSLDGVLLVAARGILKTAFLPGLGDPATVVNQPVDRRDRASSRPLGGENPSRRSSLRQRQQQQRREAEWSPEQQHYYLVFSPGLKWLRQVSPSLREPDGQPRRSNAYPLLKAVLPPRNQLPFANWLQQRQSLPPEATYEPPSLSR